MSTCTYDNPRAKSCGLSPRTGGQAIVYLLLIYFAAAENIRKTRQSEMHKGKETKLSSVSADRLPIRQFPKVILALLRNPPFLFTVLAGASEGILTSGFATFVPKFIQNHFGVTAARAALYTGLYMYVFVQRLSPTNQN